MSLAVRNLVLATALVAATGTAFAARQGREAPTLRNPLAISMVADASHAQAFMGVVEFKITNNSAEVLRVPYWQLPSAAGESNLFKVFRNGEKAEYLGAQVKRSAPTEADLVTFQPYETKIFNVDLGAAYDLSKTGEYSVTFNAFLQGASSKSGRKVTDAMGRMAQLRSATLSLWVDADNTLSALKGGMGANARKPGGGGTTSGGVSFVGCSTTQMSTLLSAVSAARNYTENAKGYLNAGTVGPRYTTWFGAYTSGRYGTVQQNFVDIDAAMDQSGNQIKINCGCNQSYYAYVYANRPYEIFVCRAFWNAPLTGTDSKAGTLVHEMSHFDVVAGTDDVVYGQSGAKSLAISDPAAAITNADSHEYFAENTPNQN
jgi:peptidyl-Lys metalloendopeptidase